jgi:hypothetical protein
VSCIHLIRRRDYFDDLEPLRDAYRESEILFTQLQAFRSSLKNRVKEEEVDYDIDVSF